MEETEHREEEVWVDVGTYPSLNEAHEHALVALAMGEAIRVEGSDSLGEFELQAEADSALRISQELEEYTAESEARILPKIIPSNWAKYPAGWPFIILWAATLVVVFNFQLENPGISDRYASSSIGLMSRGEWWRPFTALFLHGDAHHIIGNLASGTVFSILVSKSIGPAKAWFLILLSGAVGNAITSCVTFPEPFTSLGASTAVFGALGILSGVGIVENCREEVRLPYVRVLAPLLAGIILLGWLGGAEPDAGVDVFGHVFGFCAGVLAGAVCRYFDKEQGIQMRENPIELEGESSI